MSRFDATRLDMASEVQRQLASPNRLTREQARLYSQAVRLDWQSAGLRSWTEEEAARQLGDAGRLIEAARVFSELGQRTAASAAYRRAGDLLEWLSRAGAPGDGPVAQPVPLALLAAASFQLAGFPAMARGLLGHRRLPSASGNVFAAFLRADFDGVLRLCLDYWGDRIELTGPDGSWARGAGPDADLPAELVSSEVVRCLGLIAQSLRTDARDRLQLGVRKLHGLARLTSRAASESIWLTLSLAADVAETFVAASLWRWIDLLRESVSDEGQESLNGYVRSQFRLGRGLLWPSQQEGVRRLSAGDSFAMCTPTGSGKTTIAELAIVRTLYRRGAVDPGDPGAAGPDEAPLVVYLVPSRALAAEVEVRLEADIKAIDPGITVTGIYGGADWSLTSRWLTARGPTVLVCTVEMAETLLRYAGPLLIRRMRLLIVDEAHQVQFDDSPYNRASLRSAENRSARLEQFAARLFTNAPDCPAVALSAVAGGAEQAIARWIGRDHGANALGTDYRSTRQLIGGLECSSSGSTKIRLELVDGKPLTLSDREAEAYIPTPFARMPRVAGSLRSSLGPFVRCHCLWAAIQLAKSRRSVLISVMQNIEEVLADFREAFDQRDWREGIPAYFAPPSDRDTRPGAYRAKLYDDCLSACSEFCGLGSHELFLLERGIAVHHGQLPVRVRRLMTEVIRSGVVPITVATSTLTEGVNMPFDVIILPSLVRRQETAPGRFDQVTLTVPEFLNLAGRAGRPGAGVEGITLVALPADPTSGSGTKAQVEQSARIRVEWARFGQLARDIGAYAGGGGSASSPLSHLLDALWDCWRSVARSGDRRLFLEWLEHSDPERISAVDEAGSALAETLDSLDLILVSAIEEAERLNGGEFAGAELEGRIRALWSHTYARYAARDTAWLEQVFVTRALGARTNVYSDAGRRKLVFQLGLPPRRSASFLRLAATIEDQLRRAEDYASWSAERRFGFLVSLGEALRADPSFGVRDARPRRQRPGTPWTAILRWWLRVPGAAPPEAAQVRDWLTVATNDFEFRLGAAIGSTIATVWNRIHGDEVVVPTLDQWREVTGLPWSAFWLRELLSWGTLEPVVAHMVAAGGASATITTRQGAEGYIERYYDWHLARYPGAAPDDFFHPARIADWYRQEFGVELGASSAEPEVIAARLARDFPRSAPGSYAVLPCELSDRIAWLDAAGYRLAESAKPSYWHERLATRHDYSLNVRQRTVVAHSS